MQKEVNNYGLNFCEVLQIVFIVLKLCKVINWSWWVVLIPTWFTLLIFIICIIYYFIGD